MNLLLDTCVICEIRKAKGSPAVREAVQALPADSIFVSAISLGEIAKGMELLAAGRKKREIHLWLAEIDREFDDRIISVDRDTARIWGEITARAQKKGIQIPAVDGLIAATALRRGLHVMTRNTRHFAATGALIIDPWQET
ncbi:MAG: type II toxin-antitoxin system VapC family toxin [Bdellovibrionales bacterium]